MLANAQLAREHLQVARFLARVGREHRQRETLGLAFVLERLAFVLFDDAHGAIELLREQRVDRGVAPIACVSRGRVSVERLERKRAVAP